MADSGKNFLNKWNVGFYSTNVYKVGISDRMRFKTKYSIVVQSLELYLFG